MERLVWAHWVSAVSCFAVLGWVSVSRRSLRLSFGDRVWLRVGRVWFWFSTCLWVLIVEAAVQYSVRFIDVMLRGFCGDRKILSSGHSTIVRNPFSHASYWLFIPRASVFFGHLYCSKRLNVHLPGDRGLVRVRPVLHDTEYSSKKRLAVCKGLGNAIPTYQNQKEMSPVYPSHLVSRLYQIALHKFIVKSLA